MNLKSKLKIFIVSVQLCLLIACAGPAKKTAALGNEPPPKLLKPTVRKIWIPAEVRNNGSEWVEGHFLFRIEKEVVWSR